MVTRRENGKLRRYAHISTGNYNPRTARLYTDLGLLTSDAELTSDADMVFRQLASLGKFKAPRRMLLAPFNMHGRMLELLGLVEKAALAGDPAARVVVKINALTDAELIHALLRTAKAGAKIDLIVRGACMLPPGLPGVSDNIVVRSVVGRFLEHTRVLYFCWGAKDEETALYLSSADWMSRNMFRRIEVAWPVLDVRLRQRVIDEALQPYLHDTMDAWQLGPDGRSVRISSTGVSAQQALMRRYTE
jgi:polyphosphate kinase